jgi:hypothetical protein
MPACAADPNPAAWAAGLAAAGLFLFALGGPAHAAPKAPVVTATAAPLPPPRPPLEAEPVKPVPEEGLAPSDIPSPPPRPPNLSDAPAAAPPKTEASAGAGPKPETPADASACMERLVKLGVRFDPVPAIVDGLCGTPHPLKVTHLPDGFEVSPPATLACPVAEALSRWTKEVVLVEAARHLETQPTRVAIGTSYECRNRNRQANGKLSEHAFANAVDISGFEFKGRKGLQIGDHPAETPEALFQAAIRTQACAYFTTVLGPGSDAAHATHLHLDLRGRGNGFRMCQ